MSGLRPGEKLFEELLINDDAQPTEHPKIMRAQEKAIAWDRLTELLARLAQHIDQNDHDQLLDLLRECVDGFVPHARVVDPLYEPFVPEPLDNVLLLKERVGDS